MFESGYLLRNVQKSLIDHSDPHGIALLYRNFDYVLTVCTRFGPSRVPFLCGNFSVSCVWQVVGTTIRRRTVVRISCILITAASQFDCLSCGIFAQFLVYSLS